MKKIFPFFISFIFVLNANASSSGGNCVPGVGYTVSSSLQQFIDSPSATLRNVIYSDGSASFQGGIQQHIFGEDESSSTDLRVNLIPDSSLSTYINLWNPGVCDVDYSSGSPVTTCKTFTTELSSTASIGSFLQTYASGHRSYFVSSVANVAPTTPNMTAPLYMPHTKCSNQKNTDPCYLGGSSSEKQPYLNKIDHTVYPEANYYTALVNKWYAEKSGFAFPISQGPGRMLLSLTSDKLPTKKPVFDFTKQSTTGGKIYIPIISTVKSVMTNFSADSINQLADDINSDTSLENFKLACNMLYFANPNSSNNLVNYCVNMGASFWSDPDNNKIKIFNDIRTGNNLKQYLYNLISCSGVYTDASGKNTSEYLGCSPDTLYMPNYYSSKYFTGKNSLVKQFYMQSESTSTNLCGTDSVCKPPYSTTNSKYLIPSAKKSTDFIWDAWIFSDYTTTRASIFYSPNSLTKNKSTSEPVLLLNQFAQDYTISFVSDCTDSSSSTLATLDFTALSTIKNLAGISSDNIKLNGVTNTGDFNSITATLQQPSSSSLVFTTTDDLSKYNKIYLENNYFENGGQAVYGSAPSSKYAGNCAVAESGHGPKGMVFTFTTTGVCDDNNSNNNNNNDLLGPTEEPTNNDFLFTQ